jgi:hypothetical protein
MIHCLLQHGAATLADISTVQSTVDSVANYDNFWNRIVAAFQFSFEVVRGITAASIGLSPIVHDMLPPSRLS